MGSCQREFEEIVLLTFREPVPAGPALHSEPAKWNPAWDLELPPTYKAQAYFISTEASPRPPWTDANPTHYGCRRE